MCIRDSIRPLSYGGLALANTLATTIETLTLLWLIRPRLGGLGGRRLVGTLVRSLAATLAMAAALVVYLNLVSDASPWLLVGGGILLGGLVYALFAFVFGRQELRSLVRAR